MTGSLKFGITSLHAGEGSYPEKMIRVAQLAEKAGFDSVWAGGHPFLSEKRSNFPSNLRMMDPIVALSFLAAQTLKVRLGTGIILLPQFNPVILAKQLATLDVLSSGRVIFGVGVGWSEHEYEVLGISYHERGERADDYLKAIKAIWTEEHPVYKGPFVTFDSLQAFPQPVQKPYPPIVIGGNSPGAFHRAAIFGNG
jgi:probable F420-dependent oxidoreductase